MGRKKKKPLPPRRLRMKQHARLMSARKWLESQKGRKPAAIAKVYRKWYGVDWLCAIRELGSLGIRFPKAWVAQLKQSLENARRAKARRKADREAAEDQFPCEGYGDFAFIAGYTEGGAPYGVTWDEMRNLSLRESYGNWDLSLQEPDEIRELSPPEPDALWDLSSQEPDGILESSPPEPDEFWEWSLQEPDEIREPSPPEPDDLRGWLAKTADEEDEDEKLARKTPISEVLDGADCPF